MCVSTISLDHFPQAMDGEMYEKARNVYMLYAQIDADAATLVKAEFEDLREQSYLVSHMTSHDLSHDSHMTCRSTVTTWWSVSTTSTRF